MAQVWEAPVERNRYERRWLETANAIVPGVAPRVLAGDDDGCFAMEYLPGLPVWKAELRAGRADPAFAADVGRKLAAIHDATARRADVAAAFRDRREFPRPASRTVSARGRTGCMLRLQSNCKTFPNERPEPGSRWCMAT